MENISNKVPSTESELKDWLINIVSGSEILKQINHAVSDDSVRTVEEIGKKVINNIKMKELGMDIDYVNAELLKKDLCRRLDKILRA